MADALDVALHQCVVAQLVVQEKSDELRDAVREMRRVQRRAMDVRLAQINGEEPEPWLTS